MANPFMINPLGGLNLGQAIQSAAQPFAEQMRRDEQKQEQQDLQAFITQAASGDQVAFREVLARNPQMALVLDQLNQREAARNQALDQKQLQMVQDAETQFDSMIMRAQTPEEYQAALQWGIENPLLDVDEEDLSEPLSTAQMVSSGRLAIRNPDLLKQFSKDYQQGKGDLTGYVFDTSTGKYSISPEIKSRLDSAKELPELDAKTRQSINKDFTQLTGDTKLIRNTAKDLERLAKIKSGPASIAMVFKFMKALDPTSVVREGEFATAENSAGVPEAVRNTYNRVLSGERLGDKQAEQFVTTAKQLANSAIESSTTEIESFLDTFEDTLPKSFKDRLKARMPKAFDVSDSKISEDSFVIENHPVHGNITEADIQTTMKEQGMTREQVLKALEVNDG